MMAARFRSVTWVGVALVPALACYLVTQHVAAERAELAKVERTIGKTRRDIRDLQTELGTRGSMAQIERWNTQTLALAAPTAQQFIADGVQLASLTALPATARPVIAVAAPAPEALAVTPLPNVPATAPSATAPSAAVREAAFRPVPVPVPGPASVPGATPAAVRDVAFRAAPRRAERPAEHLNAPSAEAQPLLRQANYMAPPRDQARTGPTKIAMLTGPLDPGTLADIGRIARTERGSRRP